jgi:hypothetical protein
LTAIITTTKQTKVLVTFPYKLGESGELRSSTVLALIANMRESVVLDVEEWCSNGVFNIKRSEQRKSLQLIFVGRRGTNELRLVTLTGLVP